MTHLDHGTLATHVANCTPYAWPWNGVLDPRATAALVVEPASNGPLRGTGEAVRALAAMVEVTRAVRDAGGTVIRAVTAPAPMEVVGGERGPLPITSDHEIASVGIDGFYGSSLDALLRSRGIERLILVGAGLETCVHSTMRSANDRGFECLLVIDACIPFDGALVAPSVSMIEMSGGIFGAVGSAADVVGAFTPVEGNRE